MRWEEVLSVWGYPGASELAPILEELELDPEKYHYPWELAVDLRKRIDVSTKTIFVRGEWRPLAWYDPILNFFKWVWEQISKIFMPYVTVIALVGIGGLITWIAHGYYKVFGVIPIGIGIYLLLKQLGVVV